MKAHWPENLLFLELMSYCKFCLSLPLENIHRIYHDQEYGQEENDDNKLFEKFSLEINQAGLSWDLILKKRENFKMAFDGWSIVKVSKYNEKKIQELLSNRGIVRHRKKIEAIIFNANQILELYKNNLTFSSWINTMKNKSLEECLIIFKKKFKFVGTEIVKEFLQGINIIEGAHDLDCTKYIKK